MTLGRKQTVRDQAVWRAAVEHAREAWPNQRLDNLIDRTVGDIQSRVKGKRVAYGWSGGKDSLALQHVMDLAGVEDCVLAMSNLEFPDMLRWMTDNMPNGLTIINTGQDLKWLREHPEMLFPVGKNGPKWFSIVNHRGQDLHYKRQNLDLIMLGRRRSDMNFCGPKETNEYTNAKGIRRFSPIADWPHEAVFALLDRERVSMPPCYDWPRGYQIGTGSWPARQWTIDSDHGWEEIWSIDADLVRHSAAELPQARDWLARTGKE